MARLAIAVAQTKIAQTRVRTICLPYVHCERPDNHITIRIHMSYHDRLPRGLQVISPISRRKIFFARSLNTLRTCENLALLPLKFILHLDYCICKRFDHETGLYIWCGWFLLCFVASSNRNRANKFKSAFTTMALYSNPKNNESAGVLFSAFDENFVVFLHSALIITQIEHKNHTHNNTKHSASVVGHSAFSPNAFLETRLHRCVQWRKFFFG